MQNMAAPTSSLGVQNDNPRRMMAGRAEWKYHDLWASNFKSLSAYENPSRKTRYVSPDTHGLSREIAITANKATAMFDVIACPQ